jgi:hypothetical protein
MRLHLPAVLAFSALAAPLFADATSDARNAVEKAYSQQSAAISKGDIKAYSASHAADFYEIDKKGRKQDLKSIQTAISGVLSFAKSVKRSMTVQKMTVKGSTATVSATETLDAAIPNPQTGKNSTMHAERTVSDKWAKTNGKWLRKVSKTLTEKQTMDGKEYPTGR